jgi:hypothetical protein
MWSHLRIRLGPSAFCFSRLEKRAGAPELLRELSLSELCFLPE